MNESVAKIRRGGHEMASVNSLVPSHVITPTLRESTTGLISFLEEYYKYMHQEGNPLYEIENLNQQIDLDEADEKYLDAIQAEIASIIPRTDRIDRRVLYRRIVDFYRSKGTRNAIYSFFRIFFPDLDGDPEVSFGTGKYQYQITHNLDYPAEWRNLYKALSHPAGMRLIAAVNILSEKTSDTIPEGTHDADPANDLSDPDEPYYVPPESHASFIDFVQRFLGEASFGRSFNEFGLTHRTDPNLEIHIPLIGADNVTSEDILTMDSDEYYNDQWGDIWGSVQGLGANKKYARDISGNSMHGIIKDPNDHGLSADGTFEFDGENDLVLLPLGMDDSDMDVDSYLVADYSFYEDYGAAMDAAYTLYGNKTIFKDTDNWTICFWYRGYEGGDKAPDWNPPSDGRDDLSPIVGNLFRSQQLNPALSNNGYDPSYIGSTASIIGIDDNGDGGKLVFLYEKNYFNFPQIRSKTSINDGIWHHCSVVNSNQVVSLYVDGRLEDSGPHTQRVQSSHRSYFIANCLMYSDLSFDSDSGDALLTPDNDRIAANDPEYSQGSLKDYRVYSKALTQAEINEIVYPAGIRVTELAQILNSVADETNAFVYETTRSKPRNYKFDTSPIKQHQSRLRDAVVRDEWVSIGKTRDLSAASTLDGFSLQDLDKASYNAEAGDAFNNNNVGSSVTRIRQVLQLNRPDVDDSDFYIRLSDDDSFSDIDSFGGYIDSVDPRFSAFVTVTEEDGPVVPVKGETNVAFTGSPTTCAKQGEPLSIPIEWDVVDSVISNTTLDRLTRFDLRLRFDFVWSGEEFPLLDKSHWRVKVGDVTLNEQGPNGTGNFNAVSNRLAYHFMWLNEKDYPNISVNPGDPFDHWYISGREGGILSPRKDYRFGSENLPPIRLEYIGPWPKIIEQYHKIFWDINVKIDYDYRDNRNRTLRTITNWAPGRRGLPGAGGILNPLASFGDADGNGRSIRINDCSPAVAPYIMGIDAAFGTEVMELNKFGKTGVDDPIPDTKWTKGLAKDKKQWASVHTVFDYNDDDDRDTLTKGVYKVKPESRMTPTNRENLSAKGRIVWGTEDIVGNYESSLSASYMEYPWQDLTNYLGFKVQMLRQINPDNFAVQMKFAGVWGEYWTENKSRIWVCHQPGEDGYTDLNGSYTHGPNIALGTYDLKCWPYSGKMQDGDKTPVGQLANIRIEDDSFYVYGKFTQFWRYGNDRDLQHPGFDLDGENQMYQMWKTANLTGNYLHNSVLGESTYSNSNTTLDILNRQTITNDKANNSYGTMSAMSKVDGRGRSTYTGSGLEDSWYSVDGDDYGQNLTQLFYDLDPNDPWTRWYEGKSDAILIRRTTELNFGRPMRAFVFGNDVTQNVTSSEDGTYNSSLTFINTPLKVQGDIIVDEEFMTGGGTVPTADATIRGYYAWMGTNRGDRYSWTSQNTTIEKLPVAKKASSNGLPTEEMFRRYKLTPGYFHLSAIDYDASISNNILESEDKIRNAFADIGSTVVSVVLKGGENSLTHTADMKQTNLYIRWHLRVFNDGGEDSMFIQLPWNMTKDNASFNNYLLKYDNGFSYDYSLGYGKTTNILNYLKDTTQFGNYRFDGNLTLGSDKLGTYYQTTKNSGTFNKLPKGITEIDPVMYNPNGIEIDSSFRQQERLSEFLDYAPIRGYESIFDSFAGYSPTELGVVGFGRKVHWQFAAMHARLIVGGDLAMFDSEPRIGVDLKQVRGIRDGSISGKNISSTGEDFEFALNSIPGTWAVGLSREVGLENKLKDATNQNTFRRNLANGDFTSQIWEPEVRSNNISNFLWRSDIPFNSYGANNWGWESGVNVGSDDIWAAVGENGLLVDTDGLVDGYVLRSFINRPIKFDDGNYLSTSNSTGGQTSFDQMTIVQQPRPENGWMAIIEGADEAHDRHWRNSYFYMRTPQGVRQVLYVRMIVDAHDYFAVSVATTKPVYYYGSIDAHRASGAKTTITQQGSGAYFQSLGFSRNQPVSRVYDQISIPYAAGSDGSAVIDGVSVPQFLGTDSELARFGAKFGCGWHGDFGYSTVWYTPLHIASEITGIPGMIASGIVKPWHNKLLGAPHLTKTNSEARLLY